MNKKDMKVRVILQENTANKGDTKERARVTQQARHRGASHKQPKGRVNADEAYTTVPLQEVVSDTNYRYQYHFGRICIAVLAIGMILVGTFYLLKDTFLISTNPDLMPTYNEAVINVFEKEEPISTDHPLSSTAEPSTTTHFQQMRQQRQESLGQGLLVANQIQPSISLGTDSPNIKSSDIKSAATTFGGGEAAADIAKDRSGDAKKPITTKELSVLSEVPVSKDNAASSVAKEAVVEETVKLQNQSSSISSDKTSKPLKAPSFSSVKAKDVPANEEEKTASPLSSGLSESQTTDINTNTKTTKNITDKTSIIVPQAMIEADPTVTMTEGPILVKPRNKDAQINSATGPMINPDMVKRAVLTTKVSGLEPTDTVAQPVTFDSEGEVKYLYFYTQLDGAKGNVCYYEWLKNGEIITRIKVDIKGNRWRSYSAKQLLASQKGDWKAQLVSENKQVLTQVSFKVQ